VDIAAPLLEQATRLDREAGVQIAYIQCPAEATGLPSRAFDVVSAGQCWHWFDRPAAAREVARLLASTGTAVIAHFDWLPVKGNVVEATEEIILRYTPTWPFADRAGLYPQWLVDLQTAGFIGIETFSFDVAVPYSHEAWVGRVRASAPIAGTLDDDGVRACSQELAVMLRARFAEDRLAVPHRVWAVTAQAPPVESDAAERLLRRAYEAFHARDIEGALATMHTDVDWPNGMEGGRLHGHSEVREYWRRQFGIIDSRSEPQRIERSADGQVVATVQQVVRDRAGNILSEDTVEHRYVISEGLIERMDIGEC
jgi:SAM-dependent methyltransferase